MPTLTKSISRTPSIDRHIYTVRGQRVMLDSDLAALYRVETSSLNRAVKRNIKRFPKRFMFALSRAEAQNLIFQNGISSWGGRRTPPYVFTEHGVVMLSSVLKSDRAVQVSLMVVEAFVRIREMLLANKDLAMRIEKLELTHDRIATVIDDLVDEIAKLARDVEQIQTLPLKRKRTIGF